MAVYTHVSFDEASTLLQRLQLGQLQSMEGCAGGIENTNYFVTTDVGAYVLTLFERLTASQLPFYLRLMKHLALRGIPVPEPAADTNGDLLYSLNGKPATVVNRLRGKSELAPTPAHCEAVGRWLAKMHLVGRDFDLQQPNLRGLDWWNSTVPVILPFLDEGQTGLILGELAYQNHIASSPRYAALPRGAIHADLFRDNVMFSGLQDEPDATAPKPEMTGLFDFYFAGVDTWVFDLAVCLNDWCIDLQSGAPDASRSAALLAAYESVRPLAAAERQSMPAMLRGAALRFWISRLWDLHLPREASVLQAHDPAHFERVLRRRLA